MLPSIETPMIDGFMAGAAPIIIKAIYDKIVGQMPSDLKRRIDALTSKVAALEGEKQKLVEEITSKDQTIAILTTTVETERDRSSQLMGQLQDAAEERKDALKIKADELRKSRTDERNCKKRVDELTRELAEVKQSVRETTTATELANMRAQALETGESIGDIAAKHQ
jgi:chromosome segregation ATPase